jgi:hypothetical protein
MPVVLALAYGIALLLDVVLSNVIKVVNRVVTAVRGPDGTED